MKISLVMIQYDFFSFLTTSWKYTPTFISKQWKLWNDPDWSSLQDHTEGLPHALSLRRVEFRARLFKSLVKANGSLNPWRPVKSDGLFQLTVR